MNKEYRFRELQDYTLCESGRILRNGESLMPDSEDDYLASFSTIMEGYHQDESGRTVENPPEWREMVSDDEDFQEFEGLCEDGGLE